MRARDVLLPLLLFPRLIPLLLACVEGTAAILVGDPMGDAGSWVRLVLVFDIVFVTATFFAYEFIIEE